MITGIDVNQRIEYVSKYDRSEPKTIFVLRPLSGIEMLQFSEGKQEDILNMLRKSIVEVKNYKDNTSIDEIVSSFSLPIVGELIQKVNIINNFTEQEAKN